VKRLSDLCPHPGFFLSHKKLDTRGERIEAWMCGLCFKVSYDGGPFESAESFEEVWNSIDNAYRRRHPEALPLDFSISRLPDSLRA
jgi:hypothetical protein